MKINTDRTTCVNGIVEELTGIAATVSNFHNPRFPLPILHESVSAFNQLSPVRQFVGFHNIHTF